MRDLSATHYLADDDRHAVAVTIDSLGSGGLFTLTPREASVLADMLKVAALEAALAISDELDERGYA